MKIDLYTQDGQKKGEIDVNDKLFAAQVNEEVIRLALLRQQAHERRPVAHTKTRGEVNATTRKMYRQKGTGRARMGGRNNPIRRGGGTIFGPRNTRAYTKRLPKAARRLALFSLLSRKAADKQIIALEKYETKAPKTKAMDTLLKKLSPGQSVLLVLDRKDAGLEKSACNLPYAKTILVDYLNPFDLLKYEKALFLQAAFSRAEELFL